MIKIEKGIEIDRPAHEVFAYVSDHTNAPRWQRGLAEVSRLTDDPIGVGTRHLIVRSFMGRRTEATNEFTLYEPNRLVAFKFTSGSVIGQASYVVDEAAAHGVRLIARLEMQPTGLSRLAEPLMAAALRRDVEANLIVLKRLLEANAGERSMRAEGQQKVGS